MKVEIEREIKEQGEEESNFPIYKQIFIQKVGELLEHRLTKRGPGEQPFAPLLIGFFLKDVTRTPFFHICPTLACRQNTTYKF